MATIQIQEPPEYDIVVKWIPVGLLNRNFAQYKGPQRNRPEDSSRYRVRLATRAKAYGKFQWALLKDRVVSERSNGVLYPLDGNSSNHWLEGMYGPNFEVPCKVVSGLTLTQENRLFQDLQVGKKVTVMEKYAADLAYDSSSTAYQIDKALPEGFRIGSLTRDPYVVPRGAAEWVADKYGAKALTQVLLKIASIFGDTQQARTNSPLVRAVAVLMFNPGAQEGYDMDLLWGVLGQAGAGALSSRATGTNGEQAVLRLARELYDEYLSGGKAWQPR